jgi:hypothetical protein
MMQRRYSCGDRRARLFSRAKLDLFVVYIVVYQGRQLKHHL